MASREEVEEILSGAVGMWQEGASFRRRRKRCRDYTFGRQWNDTIRVGDHIMTERNYIMSEGCTPFTNNLIRRIVRNVLGVFHKRLSEIEPPESELLREAEEENRLKELYARTMEEFLVSGVAIHRKWLGINNGKPGIRTAMVSPDTFFFNNDARDVRGWDRHTRGQIHEVSMREWCTEFVRTREEYERMQAIFEDGRPKRRVVEVWRHERRPRLRVHDPERGVVRIMEDDGRINCRRANVSWFLDDVWRYYFIDSDGILLREGDSPYLHGSHPFIFKAYPYLDGEIHSFVGDIIDQQRYTNRLITLYDWVIRASAKGVLLIPNESVPKGKLDETIKSWSRCNGVITYNASASIPPPQQVVGNISGLGVSDLLGIQLKMLEDISGVNATLQGNLAAKSTSGTLYTQQTENAMTSLTDLMESFSAFMRDCRRMDEMLVKQLVI